MALGLIFCVDLRVENGLVNNYRERERKHHIDFSVNNELLQQRVARCRAVINEPR